MEQSEIFYFDSFDINLERGVIQYNYSVDNTHTFSPVFEVDLSNVSDKSEIESAVFALGMAFIPSFYKAFITDTIVVRAGYLDDEQVAFWEHLYLHGLGEFYFKNDIDPTGKAHIVTDSEKRIKKSSVDVRGGYLVAVGGGKDSAVSGLLLEEKGIDFDWFSLNTNSAIEKFLGNSLHQHYVMHMPATNFTKIIELNRQGAPNGHIPISAVYGFSATLHALINGYSHIVFSNEKSASESNTKMKMGNITIEVNHQYSKSYEWEQMMHSYIRSHIHSDLYYFSLLRNMHEAKIFQLFTDHIDPYRITSCNAGLKDASLCGVCPKCLFVFTGLSAFLDPERVIDIFSKDLFEDKTLEPLFIDMLGRGGAKPFDCVGTFEETNYFAHNALEKRLEKNMQLPYLLKNNQPFSGFDEQQLLALSDEHNIPQDLL